MKHYLGIDLGGTNVAFGIVDEHYRIIAKKSIPTAAQRPFPQLVADIATTAQRFVQEMNISNLCSVGMGVPGTIDPITGTVLFANNLGWVNVDVCAQFRKHWDIPLHIANDATCALLGEARAGGGVGHSDFMMITLGTGVGGGILVGGHVYLGGNGLGCELGHTLFIYNGLPCSCGRHGCLEQYISVSALRHQTRAAMEQHPQSIMHQIVERHMDRISGKTAFVAQKQGDPAAIQVVNTYISYLAAAIISLFTAYRSPLIMIGGGISNEGENLFAPVRSIVDETIRSTDFMEPPTITKATLGGDAGIIGAALLGINTEQGGMQL